MMGISGHDSASKTYLGPLWGKTERYRHTPWIFGVLSDGKCPNLP